MKKITLLLAISIGFFVGTSMGFGLGDLQKVTGGSSSSSEGGASISEVLDTYIDALIKTEAGQKKMAAAFESADDQEAILSESAAADGDKSAKAASALSKSSKDLDKQIKANMSKLGDLSAEQKALFAEGAALYISAVPDLIKLSKQVKDVQKPGFSDIANLGKFKELVKIPSFVGNVLKMVPNLLTAHKEGKIKLPAESVKKAKAF